MDGVAAQVNVSTRRPLPWLRIGQVAPMLVLFGLFFVIPCIEIVRISFSGSEGVLANFAQLWASPVVAVVFLRTIQLALSVTLLCVVLGYPAACFIALQPAHRRAWLQALILLPFWTSVLVRTYTWSILLGREGVLNAALMGLGLTESPQRFMFTPLAVHLGMVQILLPIAILTLVGVMTELDDNLVRAARVLGASTLRAFVHVFLPMTRPGITAAAMLTFILALGFYITPALLGGPRQRMIANLIEVEVHQMNNWAAASAMALVLLVITVLAVAVLRWLAPQQNLYGGR
jgi:putative spermidine/putrescine transport system permease protein